MAQAKSTKATTTAPKAKQGQKGKPAAKVLRPAIPTGWLGNADGNTPTAQGVKPSVGYPQGTDICKLVAPTGTLGANQQQHYNAISAALGTSNTMACAALVAAGATRRNIRRAVRAGVLVWQPAK